MKDGKVIDNFDCYLVSILNSQNALNSEVGDKVTIYLASGFEINAEVKYISKEENGKVLVVFDLKTLTDELIQYRKISYNITWWSFQGLKVPNTSILEDENGLKYVVRKKSGQNKKIYVKVLKRNDKYSIVTNYEANEMESLGIDMKANNKIIQYDNILVYPSK